MRLTTHEVASIKKHIYALDPHAQIYLFGSRVNDQARGGDIDLLIISPHIDLQQKIQIKLNLYQDLGEQKIDLIVSSNGEDSFAKTVREKGILL